MHLWSRSISARYQPLSCRGPCVVSTECSYSLAASDCSARATTSGPIELVPFSFFVCGSTRRGLGHDQGTRAMTKAPFVAAALAAAFLSYASSAEARGGGNGGGGGPHGGPTAEPSSTPATPQSDPSPPGWSSPGQRQGWDGGSTPPGWDNGQRKGWDDPLPPGFDLGDKKGWDTTVKPAPTKQ